MSQIEQPIKAAQTAAQELDFEDDLRASADYRRQICPVLVRRAIEEVFQ
jgi:CO/xanthine dehydrogenase FAD-binding subunit